MSLRRVLAVTLAAAAVVVTTAPARAADPAEPKLRDTLFVGVDTSGSFRHAGYEDAMTFLVYYLYGHVNELGGLARPRDLFVAAIGGKESSEGFPIIPGRYGQIEWFDGRALAVYSNHPKLFRKLWAIANVRRHQTGDDEMRAVFPLEALAQWRSAGRPRISFLNSTRPLERASPRTAPARAAGERSS